MGVVISFPDRGRSGRRRRGWRLAVVGLCAGLLVAAGVVLAGQDLLRGGRGGLLKEAAGRSASVAPVIPDQAAVSR